MAMTGVKMLEVSYRGSAPAKGHQIREYFRELTNSRGSSYTV